MIPRYTINTKIGVKTYPQRGADEVYRIMREQTPRGVNITPESADKPFLIFEHTAFDKGVFQK